MLFYDDLDQYIAQETARLQTLNEAHIPAVGVVLDVLAPNGDQDIASNPGGHSVTQSVQRLTIDCHGIDGDRHRGLTRPATGREAPLYQRSRAHIVNRRQLFAVSPHECTLLSEQLGVEITPQLLGANLVIGRADGAPFCLSDTPVNTYFALAPAEAEHLPTPPLATLIHYVQQKGCSRTGKAVAKAYDDTSLTKRFVDHSEHRRGILCSVEYPVKKTVAIERGQQVFFRFPMGSCY
ncbi:MAG: hypothetical protein GKR89_13640 [Candidatus Latescibacteria bacterium]|nr:hypothetical protein [Candidatus Latescibacterota bacterium]